jgi:hypothetical protein
MMSLLHFDLTALSGALISGLVQLLKWIPQVPLISGQTKRIRTIVAALAFASNLGMAVLDGNTGAIEVAAGTIVTYAFAHLTFLSVFQVKAPTPTVASTQD